jgi:predicted alpha-1,2-mannosidase
MKHANTIFILVCLITVSPVIFSQDLLSYVNPNIGTAHSRWFFYTPAAVPYGMAKPGPSTNAHYGNPSGWEAVGYDTRQTSIEGFVQFHEWQVGGVNIMPSAGVLKLNPGELDKPGSGYRSSFDRKNELASPGYYRVLLDDHHIKAELTATRHVGFHRFSFPGDEPSRIILDIGNVQGESGEVKDAFVKMTDDVHMEGWVITYPKYLKLYDPDGRVSMYFYGELSQKPVKVGSFTANGTGRGPEAKGKGAGIYAEYATGSRKVVELKLGLSYTSVENAKLNLETEAAHVNFEQARQRAEAEWRRELGRLMVEGKNREDKIKFYTGLYHALLGRGIANDVNGCFPRHDGAIGKLPKDPGGKFSYNFMNSDAIWGAYWNLTQLWALCYPGRYNDYVHTQLQVYKERGWFGDGIANSNFVSGVGTNMVGLAVAAAYNAGIKDYDTALAFKAVYGNEMGWQNRKAGSGKMDVKAFLDKGFVPFLENTKNDFVTDSTGSVFSASHTLEYSFSAYAAAEMAKGMGKTDEAGKLKAYAGGWKQLFDPKDKLIHPKNADGSFIGKFDPYQAWRGFQEGNAVQYSFFVPHDPAALIAAVGKEEFNDRLENIFNTAGKDGFGGGKTIDAFAGVKSVYNHGNQPSLHTSWLFNFSGKPWLTQKFTRAIGNEFYGTEPIHGYGYGQDEDQGQLGSWYVMAALGLFDVKGFTDARPLIELGSPLFDKVAVQLGNGRKLVIEATNNSAANVYVQSVFLNGRRLNNCWLYRDELMKGGRLLFHMGNVPNKAWGVEIPPPSMQ